MRASAGIARSRRRTTIRVTVLGLISLIAGLLIYVRFFYEHTVAPHQIEIVAVDAGTISFRMDRRFADPVPPYQFLQSVPWSDDAGALTISASPGATALYAGPVGPQVRLTFGSGPDAGLVNVRLDGRVVRTLDLARPDPGQVTDVLQFPSRTPIPGLLVIPLTAIIAYPAVGAAGRRLEQSMRGTHSRRRVLAGLGLLLSATVVHRAVPVPWPRLVPYHVVVTPGPDTSEDGTEVWVRLRHGDGSIESPTNWSAGAGWEMRDNWLVTSAVTSAEWSGLTGPDSSIELSSTPRADGVRVEVSGRVTMVNDRPGPASGVPRVRFESAPVPTGRRLALAVVSALEIAGIAVALALALARFGSPRSQVSHD